MTAGRYLLGVVLVALVVVPVIGASWALRRRFLPGWTGAVARLVEIVIGLSLTLVVSELLGLVGWFYTAPEVIMLFATGALVWWRVGRAAPVDDAAKGAAIASPAMPPSVLGRAGSYWALAASAVVVAAWSARTADAFHHSMRTIDTRWYHMPTAIRFVQTGSMRGLHFVDSQPVTVFYPSNSPVFHALGVQFMGSDVLSPALNLGWLALVLLAGWCIGRPYGVAPVTLVGSLLVLATPGFVGTQPGGAYSDVFGVAFLLAAVAILVNLETTSAASAATRNAAVGAAALAAGLALGTKFTFIGPVAALTIVAFIVARSGRRSRETAIWIAGLALTGSFWYFRNLFTVGNPLPALGFGPLSLPVPRVRDYTASIADFISSGDQWHHFFLPGLDRSLGPAWWAILGLGFVAFLAAGLSETGVRRLLAFVGATSLAVFLVTKQFIGAPGRPFFFVYNVRYGAPAFVLGLVLLPVVGRALKRRLMWALMAAYCLVLAVTQLDPTIWPTSLRHNAFDPAVRGVDSVAGVLVGVTFLAAGIVLLSPRARRVLVGPQRRVLATTALVVLVVGGAFVHSFYLDRRYVNTEPFPRVTTWVRDVRDARIGIIGGFLILQYPFAGNDLSNYVQYVGVRGPHGSFSAPRTCRQWRQLVNNGRYTYLVMTALPSKPPVGPWLWTKTDRAATPLDVKDTVGVVSLVVYRISGPMHPNGCRPRA